MEVASSGKGAKAAAAEAAAPSRSRRRRSLCICLSTVAAFLLTIIIIVVILALTVFKKKDPVTTVNDVSLRDLKAVPDFSSLGLDLNVTVEVDLTVENPNKVGVKYKTSTALINYRGEQVGEAAIPAGKISAGETKPMNVTVTIMADRLLSKSRLYSDFLAGVLPFNVYARISGKVSLLGIFKFHVVSTTTCDFKVDISNRTISDQDCTYKTKL